MQPAMKCTILVLLWGLSMICRGEQPELDFPGPLTTVWMPAHPGWPPPGNSRVTGPLGGVLRPRMARSSFGTAISPHCPRQRSQHRSRHVGFTFQKFLLPNDSDFRAGFGTAHRVPPVQGLLRARAAYRHRVPFTVHPGIGYDIIVNHPLYHGGAIGRAATTDARVFAASVDRLDGGVFTVDRLAPS